MIDRMFHQTLAFFSEQFQIELPQKSLEEGNVTLRLDTMDVLLKKGMEEGALCMEIRLGFLLAPLDEEQLKTLVTANFLGVGTLGCALALESSTGLLSLKIVTSPGTSTSENWDWLHRLLFVANNWAQKTQEWAMFLSLITPSRTNI